MCDDEERIAWDDDEERIAWESAWRAMPHHRLVAAPGFAVADGVAEQLGEVVVVTVSLVPPEYSRLFSQRAAPDSEMCAVCGKATSEPMRLLAKVNVRFDSGIE